MDEPRRLARLPVEPICCAAPQETDDILCPGSDDELDEPARFAKRLRYEDQGLRYLEGRPPRLISVSLRGPFEKDWQNPWLPRRQKANNSVPRPAVMRPAVKTTAPRAFARRPGSKDGTPISRDSMQCHLPSPESNRELQLDDRDSLDPEARFRIQNWANGVPPDTLDKDEFWAPGQGRDADSQSSSKKRPAVTGWLKSKLSKRIKSDHASSITTHTPTPAAAVVHTAAVPDLELPITSLEMTTPSSSTGQGSAISVAKSFELLIKAEDTDMSSDSSSSSGRRSRARMSEQETTGVKVDTWAPPAVSSADHRHVVYETNEVGEANGAFESHMDNSFHYRSRPARQEVARSALPMPATNRIRAQPPRTENTELEETGRSRSCEVQKPMSTIHHLRQECLTAIPETVDDMANGPQEAQLNATPPFRRASSLPPPLRLEGYMITVESDAFKRAQSLAAEQRPSKQHKSASSQDDNSFLVSIGYSTAPQVHDGVMSQTEVPSPPPSPATGEVIATPGRIDAGEVKDDQDMQTKGQSRSETEAFPTATTGVEHEINSPTHAKSLDKPMLGEDTTLIGHAMHSDHEPNQDIVPCAPEESKLPSLPSENQAVDDLAGAACPMPQDTSPLRVPMPGPTVPMPKLDEGCVHDVAQRIDGVLGALVRVVSGSTPLVEENRVQDVAQKAMEDGSDAEHTAMQNSITQREPAAAEHSTDSPAKLSEHLEERPKTPIGDEHADEDEVGIGEDDQVLQTTGTRHIASPDALGLKGELVEEIWIPCSRHQTLTSTPSPRPEESAIEISQQTPWASTGREETLELEMSVKSFAKFNTPSPKPRHRSCKYPWLSREHLPSTPLLFDAANTNPWGAVRSRSRRRVSRRVSFAPLPGEEETPTGQSPAKPITRPESPPPSFDLQEDAEDLDDQFSSHFDTVRRRCNLESKPRLQRLIPTESQQQLSPTVDAMAAAFREADAYHADILEDCPTPASDLQKALGCEEVDERAPQSPWRNDTQAQAVDDVAAVLQNLDDFLNPRWDIDTSGKTTRASGGINSLEDQENRYLQVGLEGPSIWEMA